MPSVGLVNSHIGSWFCGRVVSPAVTFLDFSAHEIEYLEHPEALCLSVPVPDAVGRLVVAASDGLVVVAVRVERADGVSQLARRLLYIGKAHYPCHHGAAQLVALPAAAKAVGEVLACGAPYLPSGVHNLAHLLLEGSIKVSHTHRASVYPVGGGSKGKCLTATQKYKLYILLPNFTQYLSFT